MTERCDLVLVEHDDGTVRCYGGDDCGVAHLIDDERAYRRAHSRTVPYRLARYGTPE